MYFLHLTLQRIRLHLHCRTLPSPLRPCTLSHRPVQRCSANTTSVPTAVPAVPTVEALAVVVDVGPSHRAPRSL